MPRRKGPRIPDALLDQLLGGADAKTAFDPNGLLDDLKKALAERALNAEIDHHLDGEAVEGRSNSRNGYGKKTVLTDTGAWSLRFRATGCRRSIRSSSPNISAGSRASTRRSCRCMRAA